ncbi:MAG: hypothetical protein M3M84_06570 [Thermoproteota archaeon]|nr:hypothetical protein [Thermoproteota archaeon]
MYGVTILIEFLFSFIVSKYVNSINESFVIRIVITIQLFQMTVIGSVISVNTTTQTPLANTEIESEKPYITVGNLNLNVTKGKVTDFIIDFIMLHTDGTTFHTHQLNNFKADSVIPILLNPDGTTVISGMVDVGLNGDVKWTNVHTIVLIKKLNAISINPSDNATEDHFKGQTIYGAITSLVDQNGNKVIARPASDLA